MVQIALTLKLELLPIMIPVTLEISFDTLCHEVLRFGLTENILKYIYR